LEEEGIADVDMPPRLEERRRLPAYATPAEVRRICEAWREIAAERAERNDDPSAEPTLWYIPAWKFAFWQALRKSEITALRVGAVDLDARRLRVGDSSFVPKGKDEATIPLVEPAAKIARAWGAGERPPGERLFRHDSPQYLARAFREARKRALPDKPRLSLHGLRHGRCVDLLEKGKRLHIVQRFLRHKSLDATMRYVQIVDRSLREELDDLGESPLE
jgi:integrase